MDWDELQNVVAQLLNNVATQLQKLPGSSIAWRYIKSSHQNDPIRSAVELFLFLFAVRYLLASSYSVQKHKGHVDLTEDVGRPVLICKSRCSQLRRKSTNWLKTGHRNR